LKGSTLLRSEHEQVKSFFKKSADGASWGQGAASR